MKSSVFGWDYVDNTSAACLAADSNNVLGVDSKSTLLMADIPRLFSFYDTTLLTKNSPRTDSLQRLPPDPTEIDWILLSENVDELLLGERCHALVG